jgi:hypothetical protein
MLNKTYQRKEMVFVMFPKYLNNGTIASKNMVRSSFTGVGVILSQLIA